MSAMSEELTAEDREIVELAKRLPWKPLGEDHRRRLAAEVMAQADVAVVRSRRRSWAVAAAVVAAAALALLVGTRRETVAHPPAVSATESPELVETSGYSTSATETPPPGDPELRGVVQLHDGELTIDTRERGPVTIVAGTTRVTITGSRATVVARRGVIVTTRVFAGTAEIREAGQTRIVEAGEVWTPSPAKSSLQSFRTGYELLRDGKFVEAITALDAATDPVVLEDARFWAAIACERAGKKDEAAGRLEASMAAFPASPRLDDARSALERVTR